MSDSEKRKLKLMEDFCNYYGYELSITEDMITIQNEECSVTASNMDDMLDEMMYMVANSMDNIWVLKFLDL